MSIVHFKLVKLIALATAVSVGFSGAAAASAPDQDKEKEDPPQVAFVRAFIEAARQAGLKKPENFGRTDVLDGYEAIKDKVVEVIEGESEPARKRRLDVIKDLAQGISEIARNPALAGYELDFSRVKLDENDKQVVIFEFLYPEKFREKHRLTLSGVRWKLVLVPHDSGYRLKSATRSTLF